MTDRNGPQAAPSPEGMAVSTLKTSIRRLTVMAVLMSGSIAARIAAALLDHCDREGLANSLSGLALILLVATAVYAVMSRPAR